MPRITATSTLHCMLPKGRIYASRVRQEDPPHEVTWHIRGPSGRFPIPTELIEYLFDAVPVAVEDLITDMPKAGT